MAVHLSYKPLVRIACRHGYFADGLCRTLAVTLTAAGARVCERYALRFRATPDGGIVYYDETATSLARLRADAPVLALALTTRDPLFGVYTAGLEQAATAHDGSREPRLYYFTSRETHRAERGGRSYDLLVPPGGALSTAALPARTGGFRCRVATPVRSARLTLQDVQGDTVWEQQTPAEAAREWPIDLRDRPPGRYRLLQGKRVIEEFYLADRALMQAWGVIDLFLGPLVPDATGAARSAEIPTLTLAFDSRESVWRYYIFEPASMSPYAGYAVVGTRKRSAGGNGAGDIGFRRRADPVIINGRTATVFESMSALPLAEVPAEEDCAFTFRPNGGDRGGPQVRLPFAQPSATRVEMTGSGEQAFSEIFVYL